VLFGELLREQSRALVRLGHGLFVEIGLERQARERRQQVYERGRIAGDEASVEDPRDCYHRCLRAQRRAVPVRARWSGGVVHHVLEELDLARVVCERRRARGECLHQADARQAWVGVERAEQHRQPCHGLLLPGGVLRERLRDPRARASHRRVQHREETLLEVLEQVVERRARDARRLGYLSDRCAAEASLGDDLGSCPHDARALHLRDLLAREASALTRRPEACPAVWVYCEFVGGHCLSLSWSSCLGRHCMWRCTQLVALISMTHLFGEDPTCSDL
jgi:hypothetical protein